MIDTHCHLNFDSYDQDREAVIARADDAGVTRIIVPAIDVESSRAIVDLAARQAGVYGAAGIHPNSSADFDEPVIETLARLAQAPKMVAVGEIGLDYYRDWSPRAAQIRAFEAQLALAAALGLPVIIHNRDAHDDLMAILEAWARALPPMLRERPGVLHSFSAPLAIAERALAAGFYLGFTGPITYRNADDLRAVAARVPLERLLVETDAPFLTPVPHRGQRNEPAHVPLIVGQLASLKQVSNDEIARATTANAEKLFRL